MDIIACPECKETLELEVEQEDAQEGEILEGSLRCPTCGGTYRISGGIPDLRPLDGRT